MKHEVDDLLVEDEFEPEELEEHEKQASVAGELEEEGGEEEVLVGLEPTEERVVEDVEPSLHEVLLVRVEGEEVAQEEEEEEEEERAARSRVAPDEEEVIPRTSDEFVCQFCFLVKHRRQLADPTRSLCTDCANNSRRHESRKETPCVR